MWERNEGCEGMIQKIFIAEQPIKIALVVSRFNASITDALASGAIAYLREQGLTEAAIKRVDVPGAIEIPLITLTLAKTKRYDAIIALGAVIRGETSHYDYVCEQVSQGCQRVALENEIPVIFGVLTTETIEQAEAR